MNTTPETTHHDDAFADRLRHRLDAEVGDLPAGRGPAAAAARGRSRRRNRRAALASVAAIALVGGVAQLGPTDPGRADVATAADAVLDETLQFDWTVTDDGLGNVPSFVAGDAGVYALSTAPRSRLEDHPDGDLPRAMYRLADDGTWAPIALDGEDPAAALVSERGGLLYALSTGTVAGSDGAPLASASDDGGRTWVSVPLRTAEAPSDDVAWNVYHRLHLASTGDATVALVTARIDPPWQDLFPELDETEHQGYAIERTEDGYVLLERTDGGAEGDVVRTVPWDELGIDGTEDLTPQTFAYVADGAGWTEVPTPLGGLSPDNGSVDLQRLGDALLLTTTEWHGDGASTSTAQRSVDGVTWTPLDGPVAGQLLAAGDTLVHLSQLGGNEIAVQVSPDGGATWAALDLGALDESLSDLSDDTYVRGASGPLGAAIVVSDPERGSGTLLFSTDGERWNVTDLAEVAPDGSWLEQVIVGTDRLVLLARTTTGAPASPERSATLVGVPRRT
jgi:hypothetical protein